MKPRKTIKLRQLVVAPFDAGNGLTYSTLGLGEDGAVYRYDPKCGGWIPWSMEVATCRDAHKGKR